MRQISGAATRGRPLFVPGDRCHPTHRFSRRRLCRSYRNLI